MSGSKRLILALLAKQPMNNEQLRQATSLHPKTLTRYLWEMRKAEPKQVYISGWVNYHTYIHSAGDLPDVPKPKPLTREKATKKYRAKVKKDPERRLRRMQVDRAYKARKKMEKMKRDPLMAALFG